MNRIAKFEKVSIGQFTAAWKDTFQERFAKLTNDSNEDKTVTVHAGEGFMQGIFVQYGITVDDEASAVRNGGFGSTTK